MKNAIRLFFLWFGLAVSYGAVLADAQKPLDAGGLGSTPISLTEYFGVLEDPSLTLTLADVQGTDVAKRFDEGRPPAAALTYDFTRSAYWLRLRLRNTTDRPLERMLEIAYARLSTVQFHQPTANGTYQTVATGAVMPLATRPHPNRYFVFPVTLPAQSDQVYYLRVQAVGPMLIPARLWEPQAFHAYERSDYLGQAWYFGMATAMVLFNLLLFIALRDGIYLLYVNFVLFSALTIAAQNGLTKEFLWPDAALWSDTAIPVGFSLALATLLLFMRRMLNTGKLIPRLDGLLKILIGIFLLSLIAFSVALSSFTKPAVQLNLATAILIICIGLVCAFKRQRSAYFFVAAFAMLMLGGATTALRSLGMLPTNLLTINGLQLGSALEMLLLAFALADRFNEVRQEKEKAQGAALVAERRLVESLQTSERLLEARVGERTAELSSTILRLRQTQADLVQAEKLASLGSLVAGVAHELNTPIGNALTTATTLHWRMEGLSTAVTRGDLRRSTLADFIRDGGGMVDLVTRCCQRAASLINSFKQVAADQTEEQRDSFDLLALIKYNIEALRPSLEAGAWKIEIDIPSGVICESYPGPLGQVVSNLVQNAVTHAFDASTVGVIRITAAHVGSSVELCIADNGKGMDDVTLSRIFEPFFTTQFGQGGSGLGLSISLNIVTGTLGGSLRAQSEAGGGSRFLLSFPQVAPHMGGAAV